MNPLRRRWLLVAAILPLLYLPLRAAEPPQAAADPGEAVPLPPPPEPQAAEEAEDAAPEPPARAAQPADAGRDEGERLSLDNNLSFPVDI